MAEKKLTKYYILNPGMHGKALQVAKDKKIQLGVSTSQEDLQMMYEKNGMVQAVSRVELDDSQLKIVKHKEDTAGERAKKAQDDLGKAIKESKVLSFEDSAKALKEAQEKSKRQIAKRAEKAAPKKKAIET